MPIVVKALGTVSKNMKMRQDELLICGIIKTIQPTALLKSVRILTKLYDTWRDLLSPELQSKTCGKKHAESENNNNNDNILLLESCISF